jgi:hypothetical protein
MTMLINLPTFSDLPLEIRLEIYDYLFVCPSFSLYRKPNSLDLCSSNAHDPLFSVQKPVIHHATMPVALLLTSTQIHAEASTVLYSRNSFEFHDPKVLLAFLVKIGQKNTAIITSLHINVPWNQGKWVFWPTELLCKLSEVQNLRAIEITFESISRTWFQKYGFGSHDDIISLVLGCRLSLEFNLGLALGRLPALERVVIWGRCSEGWLECLRKKIGCEVLLRSVVGLSEHIYPQEPKHNMQESLLRYAGTSLNIETSFRSWHSYDTAIN